MTLMSFPQSFLSSLLPIFFFELYLSLNNFSEEKFRLDLRFILSNKFLYYLYAVSASLALFFRYFS